MKNNEYISNAVSFSKRIERVAREKRMRESLPALPNTEIRYPAPRRKGWRDRLVGRVQVGGKPF